MSSPVSVGDQGGASVAATSTSGFNYLPYQRKSHTRNGSTLSQTSQSTLLKQSRHDLPNPTASSAIHLISSSYVNGSSSSSLLDETSNRKNSSIQPPVALGSHRNVRSLQPPPPLRSASALKHMDRNDVSNQTSLSKPKKNSNLISEKSAGKQAVSSAEPSGGTTSIIQRSNDPTRSPSKRVPAPSKSLSLANRQSQKTSEQLSVNGNRPSKPLHTRNSSLIEASNSSSNRSSPGGTSVISIPPHLNSYATLLAAQSKLGPIPVPQGVAIANAVGVDSSSTASFGPSDGRTTAYHPGFQPKGTYRIRTDDFMKLRRKKKSQDEIEEQRMERRLAKLIAIHFAPISSNDPSSSEVVHASSRGLLDFDLDELKRDPRAALKKGGSELWSSIRSKGKGQDPVKMAAEQAIVRWQDDADVKQCPICNTTFSFTVRKHHCRLCGRVVCASPHLSRPSWPEQLAAGNNQERMIAHHPKALEMKCSSLIIANPITGKIQDAKDSVTPSMLERDLSSKAGGQDSSLKAFKESATKGVRICRDCKQTISKRQYMIDDEPYPAYIKLYEALTRVQKEIEESLPEFQEMVLGLQKHDHSAALGSSAKATLALQRDAAQARKQLLANFAYYDELAKRIRRLPSLGPSSSSGDAAQERLQQAIYTKANLFLQQNMLPLRSLPTPGSKPSISESNSNNANGSSINDMGTELNPNKDRSSSNPIYNNTPATGSFGGMGSFRSLFGGGSNSQVVTLAEAEGDFEVDTQDTLPSDVKELEQQLHVLLEQERLVADYVESASKARKFDDARTLKKSHDELCKEILRIQKKLVIKGSGK